jgi:hypothetical protein
VGWLGLTLTAHHSCSAVTPAADPLTSLSSPALVALPSSNLLLLLLVTSSDVEPYPLALLPRCRSPSSTATGQRLGPAVESHDSGVWPLSVGSTAAAPDCRMDSTDPAAYRSLMGRLWSMEAPTAEARLGMESARSMVWWFMVPAILGVSPVTDGDPRRSVDHRRSNEASDYRDEAGFIFVFFSHRLSLTPR